jgi:hypothetical protein
MDHLDPLSQLPTVVQWLIAAVTFVLIFDIGRYIMLAFGLARWIWTYERTRYKFVDSDDSRRNMAVPTALTEINSQLYALGYLPFGTLLRTYPSVGHGDIFHILTSQDETTTARFRRAAPPALRVSFVTWFRDDSVIVTEYPHGTALETNRIVNNFLRGSLSAAHEYHYKRVAEWAAQGRVPKPIGDMADYIRHQAYFMAHYRGLFGHRQRNRMAVLLVPTLLAAGAAIGALIAMYKFEMGWAAVILVVLALLSLARNRLSRHYSYLTYHPPGAADDAPETA